MTHEEDSAQYLTIWEFRVRAGCESEFESVYGPHGDWVRLFSKGQGFMRTELNHDLNDPRRYLTLDYWSSKEAYETFREQYRAEYTALDQRCEGLTERETAVGIFERVAPGPQT
jgi:heme-degrading monooxygenase HmoA